MVHIHHFLSWTEVIFTLLLRFSFLPDRGRPVKAMLYSAMEGQISRSGSACRVEPYLADRDHEQSVKQ